MKQISQIAIGLLIALFSTNSFASTAKGGARPVELVRANNEAFKGRTQVLEALKSLRKGLPNEEARKVPVKVVIDGIKAMNKSTATLEQFLVFHPGMTDAAIQATIGTSDNAAIANSLMAAVSKKMGENSRFSTDESDTSMQTIGSVVEFMTNGTANAEQASFARDLVTLLNSKPNVGLFDVLQEAGGKYFKPKAGVPDLATWLRLLCECTGRCKG